MNPTRLAELNQQRALVRQHLAWLDAEIARESPDPVLPQVVQDPLVSSVESIQVATEAEAYRPDPVSAANDTRRGCFIAMAVISLLIVGAFAAIYFLHYRDRPLLFVSDEPSPPPPAESAPAFPSPPPEK